MICSNEPGYYEDGGFGIRVENLLVIKEADTEFRCAACEVLWALLLAVSACIL
jgi:Xaa-Pro aminopeptidase